MRLQLRQIRIGSHVAEQRHVIGIDRAVRFAGKERGEVETKPVDMHLLRPMARAVHDHLAHVAVHGIECVAGAGEIFVRCCGLIKPDTI